MIRYFFIGLYFGIVLVKGEAVSWFRMQEMFRLQGAKMFLIFASAVVTSAIGVALIKRSRLRTVSGDPIEIPPKDFGTGRRYIIGSVIFGAAWAITGACPGPMFALAGTGVSVMIVVIVAALAGAWVYGLLRPRLPH
jgi:uncharacterized protein